MNRVITALPCILSFSLALAQSTPTPPLQRQVQGQTITSKELPSAEFIFDKSFRYVGGQVVNLYGNADAEQHLFVKAPKSGPVESFYWVQFEHFLPGNAYKYDYPGERNTDPGVLPFLYDVKSFSDYAAIETDDPASDGAAISKLLAQHNLVFPKRAARVRMVHLPTSDLRTELMIIYGETLPEGSKVPASTDGIRLDNASPDSAKLLLDHVRQGLTIRKR